MKRRLIVLGVAFILVSTWVIVSLCFQRHHPRRRWDASAVVLADGKVLLAGGDYYPHHLSVIDFLPSDLQRWWWDRHRIYDYFPPRELATDCDLFDPKTETWSSTGSLVKPDFKMNLILLKSGAVFGIGKLGITQIYESGSWRFVRDLGDGYACAPLPSGEVLAISDKKCQIYNPQTDKWRITAAFSPHASPFIQPLKNGRVLAIDDTSTVQPLKFYDPQRGEWTSFLPSLPARRWGSFAHTLLPDGRLFICGTANPYYGGSTGYAGPDEPTAVLFDFPHTSWNILFNMPESLDDGIPVTLQDGRVLVVNNSYGSPSSFLYDPTSNRWSPTGRLSDPNPDFAMIMLPDGRVLAFVYKLTELYDPHSGIWTVVQDGEK